MKKKTIIVGSVLSLTALLGTTAFASSYVKAIEKNSALVVNGQVASQSPALVYGGTTYVQLYGIEKALGKLGFRTKWDGTNFSVTSQAQSTSGQLQGSVTVGSTLNSSSTSVSGNQIVANTPFYAVVTASPNFGQTSLNYYIEQNQNGVWNMYQANTDAVSANGTSKVDTLNLSQPGQYRITYLDNYSQIGQAVFTVQAPPAVSTTSLPYSVTYSDGLKITVNSVQNSSSGVTLNVTATDVGTETNAMVDFSSGTTSISDNGPSVAYVTNDSQLDNPIQPGESVTGNVQYGPLQNGVSTFTWYFWDFDSNTHSITFSL